LLLAAFLVALGIVELYSVLRHFQQYFSYIVAVFYWWRKPEYLKKTTDMSQPRHEWGSTSQRKR
jgi:hypothetical protein